MTLTKRMLAAVAFVGVTATQAAAVPTVIDFDSIADGATINAQFAAQGVTFANAVGSTWSVSAPGTSGTKLISLSDSFSPQQSNPIEALFANAQSMVSIVATNVGSEGAILKAFDALVGGNLVGSDSYTGTGAGVTEFDTLMVSGSGILRLELSQIGSGRSEGMLFDNLSFEAMAPVPLPAGLPLLLAGLGAFAVIGRRKNAAK